ncbi:hypothetical protein HHK36_021498 [Tetracentron sinense]|uniref:peptidylprolyl isomerase n=1 Tax=Tetracentron sinense TaxID=13715 RepID=A0A835D9Z7_TETSI|nr:hypothetical protein HHK36_021498 [Tetracentron sinense]
MEIITKKKNPLVFLDVSIDGDPAERMSFELFYDTVPKTAENFRALCTGEKGIGSTTGKPLHYKGSIFHRIIKGLMAQGGDFSKRDGTGGESIYGGNFADESSRLKHDGPGLLSMANDGRNAYGSQFFITFEANHRFDRKHVVFGKLVEGHEILKKIEHVGTEEGRPDAVVKIINCGELLEGKNHRAAMLVNDKKKLNKLKAGKDASSDADNHEVRRKGKHKKPPRERRKKKKRRYRYYTSESDSSSDTDTESSESDSDSDSYSSSSSYISSSSDDRRRKRKRSSKKDKYRRGKRRDKRREKRRKRRDKRLKRKSKRTSESLSNTESKSTSESNSEDDGVDIRGQAGKPKNSFQISAGNQSPSVKGKEASSLQRKKGDSADVLKQDKGESPRKNGDLHSNGVEAEAKSDRSSDRQPDVVDDHPSKSRSRSMSPKRTMSKRKSISPRRSLSKSPRPSVSSKRSASRSPTPSVHRSTPRAPQRRSISRSPARSINSRSPTRSFSRSPVRGKPLRSINSRSPARSVSRSPVRGKPGRSISRSPVRARPGRSISRSSVRSLSRRSISRSPLKTLPRRTISRSPLRVTRRIVSKSPVRVSHRNVSRSPIRRVSRKSISRSPGRAPLRRSISRSPVRAPSRINHGTYSRSPASPRRRERTSLSNHGRSVSRSASPDGSPKRIRRGRGFSQRYSYARRYRTPSPDRSPLRSQRYSGRGDRDRYSSYRSYSDRSPRRYRSPPRVRTPPRFGINHLHDILMSGSITLHVCYVYSAAANMVHSVTIYGESLDTEAEEAGHGAEVCRGAQYITAAAVIAVVQCVAVHLLRNLGRVCPHELRSRGHCLGAGAHQSRGPRWTCHLPSVQVDASQDHHLAAHLERGAWFLMEMGLQTLAKGRNELVVVAVVLVVVKR